MFASRANAITLNYPMLGSMDSRLAVMALT
jgi:hypothetical protein